MTSGNRRCFGPPSLVFAALCALQVWSGVSSAGTWTRLSHDAPANINLMLLLSDGTVMAFDGARGCHRLTPDMHGSYVNGTWSARAPMSDSRLFFSSQVLKDGRVFVAGGQYGTGSARAELYDPVTDTWTALPVPASVLDPTQISPANGFPQAFFDSNSEILPSGSVLVFPVGPKTSARPVLYNPATNAWSTGPAILHGVNEDESSWVKLASDMILTVDPFGNKSERFNPASNTWLNDSNVPVALYDSFSQRMGAALLLPTGKAFFLGSTGHTAIYTPSGSTSAGVWIAGPDIPDGNGAPEAPAAMMVTGRILCAVGPVPTADLHPPSPTTFYEYDPVANAFTPEPAPNGPQDNVATDQAAMLDLPDGTVLYSHMNTDLYIYEPTGAPLAAGKPAILSVSQNSDRSFHLTGKLLNGISEGAAYGDDLQMASNYPLVGLTDSSSNVYYARTFNWSSTSVQTGTKVVSTEFRVAPTTPPGILSLVVVANGIASDPVVFQSPCFSDFDGNGVVDDSDFVIFAAAYNLLDCADPSMPAGCPSDLNSDGVVDDSDFVIFIQAYDALVCG